MKKLNDEIRRRIEVSAQRLFLEHSYAGATMRVIAQGAGVSTANLYNYFDSKDGLFCHLVKPFMQSLDRVVYEHHIPNHAKRYVAYCEGNADGLMEAQTAAYMALLRNHREQAEMLLFHAKGSSLEHYVESFTERCAKQIATTMTHAGRHGASPSAVASTFSYRMHVVWLFATLREVLRHHLEPAEAEAVVRNFVRFELSGWLQPVFYSSNKP